MAYSSALYMHELDRKAFDALNLFPEFVKLQKAYITNVDEKAAKRKAQKKAIEDARFVLPNACATKMLVTMNARSLMNFFSLRCCNRAQWEIHELADQMLKLCVEAAPTLFAKAGPSCVRTGRCAEGSMTCGKYKDVIAKYKQLKGQE